MKRTFFLAVVVLSAMVVSPFASADQHVKFSGSTDDLLVNTTACPDFVTPQPYGVLGGNNFMMNATWQGNYVPGQILELSTDVRGWMKGDGIDVNTGLTYALSGKFSAEGLSFDILGAGDFTIKRSDGARMTFSATFQIHGAGSPSLITASTTAVCTPA